MADENAQRWLEEKCLLDELSGDKESGTGKIECVCVRARVYLNEYFSQTNRRSADFCHEHNALKIISLSLSPELRKKIQF